MLFDNQNAARFGFICDTRKPFAMTSIEQRNHVAILPAHDLAQVIVLIRVGGHSMTVFKIVFNEQPKPGPVVVGCTARGIVLVFVHDRILAQMERPRIGG